MSRFVYSTLLPSMERTEMRSSPSRVASARRPSGEMATWLTPDFSSPRASVPAGATVFPSMVKMEIEPPLRLATSARVPWRLIETPDGPLPVSSFAITAGGLARRSMTERWLSGIVFVGSAGSTFCEDVTSASPSSGVMATLNGGPTTLPGASASPITLGGDAFRSRIVTVSGFGSATIFTTPFTRLTLLSFEVTAICADAGPTTSRTASSEDDSNRMRISLADREGLQKVRECRGAMLEDGGEVRPGDLLGEARGQVEVLDRGISEVSRAGGPFAANAVQRGDAHELQGRVRRPAQELDGAVLGREVRLQRGMEGDAVEQAQVPAHLGADLEQRRRSVREPGQEEQRDLTLLLRQRLHLRRRS